MSYEALFQNALSLHEAGRLDEAERLYRQILETAPEHPVVLNLLGLVAQNKGLQDEAISLFIRAIGEKPQEVSYRYNLAFSYKLAKRYREALEAFGSVLKLNPNIKEAHNETGLIYQQLGEYDKAKQSFENALKLDDKYAEARINKAMNLRYSNLPQAAEELEKLIPAYAGEALLWFYLAQLYFERKNWPKAWAAASKTKELAPASDEARVMLGELSLLENDTEKAKIYFAKAELLNPDNLDALLRLADIYSRENLFDEAEKRYKRVLELEPKNFAAHQNYAEMLYRAKRTAEALEEYRQAAIINPKAAEVSNNLALILKDLAEYAEAAGLLLNACRLNPGVEEISINLSETITLLARQDAGKARETADRWLEIDAGNIFARKLKATLEGEYFENNNLFNEKLFDHFADNYELVMQNLGYSAALAVGRIIGDEPADIVDLGCGTGLLGAALKTPQNKITGVDISQKMLDKAAAKNVYDRLVKDDIAHFLEHNRDFDIAVMGDVCGYINDIEKIIKLLKNKTIVFTIEVTNELPGSVGPDGRYRHNPQYIEKLLRENGFGSIHKEDIVLRHEAGEEVRGMIFKGESHG
ncbi:MAG: tetratricopeptide repeat protein [Proteobacteria bacterium]|nr:tetratricopeptide repeat protein [Pseudomonadota bacterium]